MKKKILIVLLIIIVIALVGVGYFVFTDMMQEDKLKTELSELNDLVNAENINMDAVNEKLDRRITTGDYTTDFKKHNPVFFKIEIDAERGTCYNEGRIG